MAKCVRTLNYSLLDDSGLYLLRFKLTFCYARSNSIISTDARSEDVPDEG